MSMLKSVSAVGGFTLLSRLFGFVRDILMARYLGAGMAADAFWVAFKLPNFFR
ncbi:MAG: murein biosynthesis integral membrane protein MurJ, partial [Kordiimonadaceae bacterium]|nr:murein biosynthesis integral membrane protein MurJ [Kordiimonadaceae bacterium]